MQHNHQQHINLVVSLLDTPISFNRAFAKIAGGSATSGLLLSQLFYWAKTKNFGEFYKTNESLQDECSLSRSEFETARKKLLELKIITQIKKGLPCKSYYVVNIDIILNLLDKLAASNYAETQQPSMQESCKLDCGNPANSDAENLHTIIDNREYTENTTENIPPTPNGGRNHGNVIVDEQFQLPKKQPSPEQLESAVNLWLQIIDEKIKNKKWIGFTDFEIDAIKHRARTYPKMQQWEIENEIIQIDKWAWEGFDIEDALRCDYRKIQSFRASLRKRVKQDSQGNQILSIDLLNNIRSNQIKQERSASNVA